MTLEEAKLILGHNYDSHDGGLKPWDEDVSWVPGEQEAVIEGRFNADQLEAMAVVMRESPPNEADAG